MSESDRIRQQIKNLERTYRRRPMPESARKSLQLLRVRALWSDIVANEMEDTHRD